MSTAFLQITSTLCIPRLQSECTSILDDDATSQKLGQPLPESNFSLEENKGLLHPAQRYAPSFLLVTYNPVKGRYVPFSTPFYPPHIILSKHGKNNVLEVREDCFRQ